MCVCKPSYVPLRAMIIPLGVQLPAPSSNLPVDSNE